MDKRKVEDLRGLYIKSQQKKGDKFFINENRIYNQLHQSQLLDKRLEEIRRSLSKKYDCDYVAVHFFNDKNDLFFSNLDNDPWHLKYWQDYIEECLSLQISSQLQKGQNGFLFFFDLGKTPNDVRAEIVGERKEGFSIMFHNDKNGNKIQFCLTFRDGKNIDTIPRAVLHNLITDLQNSQNIIDDFMEYFEKHQTIKDSIELEKFINKYNYALKI